MKNHTIKKMLLILTILISIIITITVILLYNKKTLTIEIQTNIDETKQYLISINYPKTNISKLDKQINMFIDTQINLFKNNAKANSYLMERDELNIDYELYNINDRYINISLNIYNFSKNNNQQQHFVKTFCFDIKNNDFYEIEDIFTNKIDSFQTIINELMAKNLPTISNLSELTYLFSTKDFIIYDLRNGYNVLRIPIEKFSLNIEINVEVINTQVIKESNTNKILDPMKPTIAITFDDGPSNYTQNIIDTLKENNVNATFFVLGNKVEFYQDIIKNSIKNGNEIGNHTYNHKWLSRLSSEEIVNQLERTQTILKKTVNYTPTHLRPSYGSVNNKIRNNTDLIITLWTIDTKDWKIKNVDRIVEKALKNLEDGDIILMHDIFERTSKALKKLLPILKEQGYQIVTISELEEIKLLRTRY